MNTLSKYVLYITTNDLGLYDVNEFISNRLSRYFQLKPYDIKPKFAIPEKLENLSAYEFVYADEFNKQIQDNKQIIAEIIKYLYSENILSFDQINLLQFDKSYEFEIYLNEIQLNNLKNF